MFLINKIYIIGNIFGKVIEILCSDELILRKIRKVKNKKK